MVRIVKIQEDVYLIYLQNRGNAVFSMGKPKSFFNIDHFSQGDGFIISYDDTIIKATKLQNGRLFVEIYDNSERIITYFSDYDTETREFTKFIARPILKCGMR